MQPAVQIVDAGGGAVAREGVIVTASVSDGDGVVLAGATATTNAAGVAQFQSLTLGASVGEGGNITLLFSAQELKEVTAGIQLSCAVKPMELGVEVRDELQAGDCIRMSGSNAGARMKFYDLDVPQEVKALRITDTASSFAPSVLVRGPHEPILFLGWGAGDGEIGMSVKMLVPAGRHRILATSSRSSSSGSFRLRIAAVPEDEDTCQWIRYGNLVFLQPILLQTPVSTTQTLRAECADPAEFTVALFGFVLSPGGSVNASVSSTAFRPYVALWRVSPSVREVTDTATASTAAVTFTNSSPDVAIYHLYVGSADGTGTGSYSLQAAITNPVATSIRATADSTALRRAKTSTITTRPALAF